MRRNHQVQAPVEPSWWSPDPLDLAAPDEHSQPHPHTPAPAPALTEYEQVCEPEPPLLTHTAPLRLIDPEEAAPAERPAASVPAQAVITADRAVEVLDPASAQLVTCYAIDYLSWDATNPDRRATALARYLPGHPPARPQATGWSGRGRQRASFAVPGAARPDTQDPAVSWFDVRVLVTCYQRDPSTPPTVPATDSGELASDVSSAPAPQAPGWRALDSDWVHIEVPLIHDSTGRPHIRPDLQPSFHQPATHEPAVPGPHSLTVVPAPTEGE